MRRIKGENFFKMKEKEQNQRKEERGITLLGLIVTLIVLSILAGVSISVLTGENGIINNAITAKRETEKAFIDEQLKLAIMASYGTDGKIDLDRLNREVTSVEGEVSGTSFPVTVTKGKVALMVEENGRTSEAGISPVVVYQLTTIGGEEINESDSLSEDSIKLNATVTNKGELNGITSIVLQKANGTQITEGVTVDLANGTLTATINENGSYKVVVVAMNDKGQTVTTEKAVSITGKIRIANMPDYWGPADSTNTSNDWYAYKDNLGNIAQVNSPKLADGMTAIKYVAGSDTATYETLTAGSKWANAMTKDGSMWVWIPRYAYRISQGYHTSTAGTIEIAFVDKENNFLDSNITGTVVTSGVTDSTYADTTKWILAPGFEFGDEHLEGFWFAKYEASNTDGYGSSSSTADNPTLTLQIKPNVTSWRNITSANMFTVCRSLENSTTYFNSSTNVDTHMTKNVEWGAVAYLAHSKYGLNGQEVAVNSQGYTTGRGAGNNNYNTTTGITASTTRNVYGIYDMSGGAVEYVAACYTGKKEKLNSTADAKYIDEYSSYAISKYGDAVYETSSSSSGTNSWFSDDSYFVYASNPVFGRGGYYSYGSYAGLFYFDYYSGYAIDFYSFRPVCVVK